MGKQMCPCVTPALSQGSPRHISLRHVCDVYEGSGTLAKPENTQKLLCCCEAHIDMTLKSWLDKTPPALVYNDISFQFILRPLKKGQEQCHILGSGKIGNSYFCHTTHSSRCQDCILVCAEGKNDITERMPLQETAVQSNCTRRFQGFSSTSLK